VFEKIIVASELSKSGFDVVKCLSGLRKLGSRKCLILQCIAPDEIEATSSSFIKNIFEANLQRQREILSDQGYDVETRLVKGIIKDELNRIAEEENFSIIVVGIDQHSLIGELFTKEAAYEVIHKTRKPVLLIRRPDEVISEGLKECGIMDHILFPTDFSVNANHAFEYVKKMVEEGAQKVTVVNVQDLPRIINDISYRLEEYNVVDTRKEIEDLKTLTSEKLKKFSEIDYEKLDTLKRELLKKGNAEVDIQLLYGSPSAEIIKFVHDRKISLVVMGSQGRGFIKEIYLGSVSHNIARHSEASVFLIPAKRD